MVEISAYAARVVDRFNLIGDWLTVVVCVRNFFVCYRQYKRTKGRIHLFNIAQVVVLGLHRVLYGIIPLFEITTCAYFPLLVSLWHLAYVLFYIVMFMRLIILESGRNAMWIKIVGVCLIIVRFADWPYELAVREVDNQGVTAQDGYCWAQWEMNVLILNFVGDALANLFLSGMFVRRLYKHISSTKNTNTPQNQMIEHIARKSLVCLILTFFVNLTMNVLKVTSYLGTYSDAFTVYFELVESTLLVEALRVDEHIRSAVGCSHCGKSNGYIDPRSDKDGLHGTSHKRSKFTSFDFMPLEERQANSDPFKRSPSVDQQPTSAAAHHATSAQHATSAATDPTRRLASMDSLTTNLFSSTATPTSETTKIGSRPSEDYNFMTSPLTSRKVLSSQQQSSSQAPTAPTPALRSASPPSAYPPTYNQANVMDTYSRPLIHHREWHNDDYKMF